MDGQGRRRRASVKAEYRKCGQKEDRCINDLQPELELLRRLKRCVFREKTNPHRTCDVQDERPEQPGTPPRLMRVRPPFEAREGCFHAFKIVNSNPLPPERQY